MKKILIVVSFILLCMTIDVYANPYKKSQTVDGVKSVPCTYVAWQQAHDKMGVSLPSWGNAVNWYKRAKSAGYEVGSTPKANSIAVFSGGCCGHVAYVTKVNGNTMNVIQGGYYVVQYDENGYVKYDADGNVVYKAYNGDGICYDCTANTAIGSESGGRILTGFIYLDNIPQEPSTTKKVTTKTTTSTTTTTKTLSSDNTLKSLKIDGFDLAFSAEVTDYNLMVPNSIEKIMITAIANDTLATVAGDKEQTLKVGENIFTISVMAEDQSIKNYTLNIIREDTISSTTTHKESEKEKHDPISFKDRIMAIVFIIISILAICTIYIVRKKTKLKR